MLYFMQAEPGGPIKIGHSVDVDTRRSQLESTYGRPLKVLATMEGGPAQERATHRRFRHLRIGRTEQFRPAPDLLAFIGEPVLVGANPDAVEAMEAVGSVLTIRMVPGYRTWLAGLAERERIGLPDVIARALADYAAKVKFEAPPKR